MSSKEQIRSKDKFRSIFLKPNGGYSVDRPSNIFRNTCDLKIGVHYLNIPNVQSRDVFRPISCERQYLFDYN